jgi:ubiquinone/menaquinone biosynthesis C-methylase UbiE
VSDETIRFDDGASYELMMGRWSVLVGARFLDWIAVPNGARWLDVGCGNGAFTQLLVERCKPADVQAFDTSAEQLAYARNRLPASAPVTWTEGDAMRLPVADASRDAAVMALVLFFVPEPAVGVAEMCRAVRRGSGLSLGRLGRRLSVGRHRSRDARARSSPARAAERRRLHDRCVDCIVARGRLASGAHL